jgi:hypothetical protein
MSAPVAHTTRPAGTAQATRQQLDELDALLERMLQLPVNATEPEPVEEPPPMRPARQEAPARPAPGRPTTPRQRSYPPSYMVVETSTPSYFETPAPPRQPEAGLGPRLLDPAGPSYHEPAHHAMPDAPAHEESPPEDYETGEGDWVPLRSAWQPSAQTWKPLAETWEQAKTAPEPTRPWTPPPPVMEPAIPPAPTVSEPVAILPPAPAPEPPAETPSAWLLPAVWFNRGFDACLAPLGPVGRWLQGPAGRGFLGTVGLVALAGACALAVADGIGWTR